MNLNIGCGPFRAEGWVNTDGRFNCGEVTGCQHDWNDNRPDVVTRGLPFRSGAFERVYCGHVLEHIPWRDVRAFLEDVRRVLAPGGLLAVVGPDIYRMVQWYKESMMDWDTLAGALENATGWDTGEPIDGARHHWDCHEVRVQTALVSSGFWVESARLPELVMGGWPVVSTVGWQCCVVAKAL